MKVKKTDIDDFFNDIKDMFNDNKNSNSISTSKNLSLINKDKPGEQRTNVIYLNTDCNLRCEYCYEGPSRNGLPDQTKCTPKDIDNFLNEICKREKNAVSTIVLMGGEVFLKFDLLEYTILKAASLTKSKGGGWGFSIVSNATLFTDKIMTRYKNLIDSVVSHGVHISQEVSYDASGHYRRKWPDGSSSISQVEKGIEKLIEYKIPFRISYTVHSGNVKNLIKDCVTILEKYPLPYHTRLLVGYACRDLDELLGPSSTDGVRDSFKPYAEYLHKLYGVPICGNSCDICNICNKAKFVGNSYLSPTTGITYDEKSTSHSFQQF